MLKQSEFWLYHFEHWLSLLACVQMATPQTPLCFILPLEHGYHSANLAKIFSVKLRLFSYPSVYKYVLGAQKNSLIKTVLLSTHNIFWLRNKKNNFRLRTLIWGPRAATNFISCTPNTFFFIFSPCQQRISV